jgi:hypothetical protein
MRALAVVFLLITLLGCGYQVPGKDASLPGGVQKLYLPLFVNRTAEPRLENLLGNRVSEVFARNASISQVEKRERAEAVLEGIISSYTNQALAYDKNDDISEYRATMVIDVALRQVADGRLLWQGKLSWSSEYLAEDDKTLQDNLEANATEEIGLRLAEELLSRLQDDF